MYLPVIRCLGPARDALVPPGRFELNLFLPARRRLGGQRSVSELTTIVATASTITRKPPTFSDHGGNLLHPSHTRPCARSPQPSPTFMVSLAAHAGRSAPRES